MTGGTGLLGSWLVESLYNLGADIVLLVRDWVPGSAIVRTHLIEQLTVVRGDIRDLRLLRRIISEYEIDTVFHLAAQTIVPISSRDPLTTFETNITGTWNLLEACRSSSLVRGVIVASSDKAYGSTITLPYREDAPLNGRFPYDVSKSCTDLIAQGYAATWSMPVAIARCGNFFGGGDLNWNRLVPGTIRAALMNKNPILRSDGTPLRDYIYVEDAVSAYLTLAECLIRSAPLAGHAFNFSNGTPLSARDLAESILKLIKSDLKLEILHDAPAEIQEQYLDISRAKNLLGWAPKYSIEEGLKKSISWYREYLKIPPSTNHP